MSMDRLTKSLVWAAKLGLAGGVVYWMARERVFGTQKESSEAYSKLKQRVAEHELFRMLPKTSPGDSIEKMPDLSHPKSYQQGFTHHWNNGVIYLFRKAAAAPEKARRLADRAADMARRSVASARRRKKKEEGEEENSADEEEN